MPAQIQHSTASLEDIRLGSSLKLEAQCSHDGRTPPWESALHHTTERTRRHPGAVRSAWASCNRHCTQACEWAKGVSCQLGRNRKLDGISLTCYSRLFPATRSNPSDSPSLNFPKALRPPVLRTFSAPDQDCHVASTTLRGCATDLDQPPSCPGYRLSLRTLCFSPCDVLSELPP